MPIYALICVLMSVLIWLLCVLIWMQHWPHERLVYPYSGVGSEGVGICASASASVRASVSGSLLRLCLYLCVYVRVPVAIPPCLARRSKTLQARTEASRT